jgi:hypothetical protein
MDITTLVYPQSLTGAAFLFAVFFGIVFSILVWLALRGGHDYSVNDTQAHSVDYANVIREGHGGLTAFLWLSYAGILVWTLVYLWMHWDEVVRLFSIFQ